MASSVACVQHSSSDFGRHSPATWPIFVALAVIGVMAMVLGIRGSLVTMDLDMVGTIQVQGMSRYIFQWLTCIGFLMIAGGLLALQDVHTRRAARMPGKRS